MALKQEFCEVPHRIGWLDLMPDVAQRFQALLRPLALQLGQDS